MPFSPARTTMLVVVLAMLPTLAFLIGTGIKDSDNALMHAQDQGLRALKRVVERQRLITATLHTLLSSLSQISAIQNIQGTESTPVFTGLIEEYPILANIFLISPNGTLIASARRVNNAPGPTNAFTQQVIKTTEFSVENVMPALTGSGEVMPYSYPIRNSEGKLLGYLGATLRLGFYQEVFQTSFIPPGGVFHILDSAGTPATTYEQTEDPFFAAARVAYAIMAQHAPTTLCPPEYSAPQSAMLPADSPPPILAQSAPLHMDPQPFQPAAQKTVAPSRLSRISEPANLAEKQKRNLDPQVWQMLQSVTQPMGYFSYVPANGEARMAVYYCLALTETERPYIYAVLDIPQKDVQQIPAQRLRLYIELFLGAAACSLIIGTLLTRRAFSQPMQAILEGTRQMAQGDLAARIDTSQISSGEFLQLANACNEMARALHDSTMELTETRDAAHMHSKVKSEFLVNMTHEIRTPMNAIIGMGYLALKTPLEPQQQEYARKLLGSAKNLLVLINEILDFSKMEAGKLTLEKGRFSLPAMLETVKKDFLANVGKEGSTLTISLGAVPDTFVGDAFRVGQALHVLIREIMQDVVPLAVTLHATVGELHGVVRPVFFDIFIPGAPDDLELIERVQETLNGGPEVFLQKSAQIVSLSLVFCGGVLRLMDGTVELHPTAEGIHCFVTLRLTIDLIGGAPLPILTVDSAETNKYLPGLHILVAEDNVINQQIFCEMLEDMGIIVTVAADGAAALELCKKYSIAFDMVLMDLHMPQLDGMSACRAIRTLPRGSFWQLPIIAMTAETDMDILEECLAAGMNDYVAKPIAVDNFTRCLMRWLPVRALSSKPVQEAIMYLREGVLSASLTPEIINEHIAVIAPAIFAGREAWLRGVLQSGNPRSALLMLDELLLAFRS